MSPYPALAAVTMLEEGRGGGLDPLFLLAENVGVSGRGPSPGQPSVVRSLPAGVSSALLCMDVVGDF